ncbi:MAG: thiamine pyrophosphate-dependent enzyme [Candidatus Odinarchaeota archaeon]
MLTKQELIDFETEIKELFLAAKIRAPIHLSGGNEDQLIDIFKQVKSDDWVFSTHRSHYHALLKGIPREWIRDQIIKGNSMHLNSRKYKFLTSSIVGGILPIAVGVAMANATNRIWAFIGDMAARTGMFSECLNYADGMNLAITFVIEDNGLSTNTPTDIAWLSKINWDDIAQRNNGRTRVVYYKYERVYPHIGCGQWVEFK